MTGFLIYGGYMISLNVTSKKNDAYEIVITNNFSGLKERLETLFPDSAKVCIVTDSNVGPLYYDEIVSLLPDYLTAYRFDIAAGEASKCFDNALKMVDFLFNNSFNRKDFCIALGGGVTGDLTGFAASIYKRGIDFVQIPTSLLAMTDSSIGGKTAVDYNGVKNIVGAFNMPKLVYAALDCLNTLPEREFYAGFAEIMKAGLGFDAKFYEWILSNIYEICEKDTETLEYMLSTAVNIKKMVVEKDPFENGDRALLNLGHTIGHAIETVYQGELIHGECVALGCVAAAYISWKKDMIPMDDYYEIRDMFVPFNLPISIVTDKEQEILKVLKQDKKNTANSVNMILFKKIGKAIMVKGIEDELILQAIDEINYKEEE